MNRHTQLGDPIHLSAFDDLPYHQHTQPVSIPSTSDTHFNDGYYFGAFTQDVHVFLGLRLYPNSNAMDGFAGVVHDGIQYNLRVSRSLLPDSDALALGPLTLHVMEPMVQHRIALGENPTGVRFDLSLRAAAPPIVERSHRQYRYGRLLNDVRRYTQCARASGTATIATTTYELEDSFACRDHSWGVRASMGPTAPLGGISTEHDADDRAMRVWLPVELGDLYGFVQFHEDEQGDLLDLEGMVTDGGRIQQVVDVGHDFRYHEGSRRFRGGSLDLHLDDGSRVRWQLTPLGAPAHPQGFGYRRGWQDGRPPGVHRGNFHLEHDLYEVGDPWKEGGPSHLSPQRWLGGMEFICRLEDEKSREGLVQFEHAVYREGWLAHRVREPD